jgi:3-oxoacyl-(acyl-carrier-protein) synthase
MTAPNPEGIQRCIRTAVELSRVEPADIDAINGHFTGTFADPLEMANWRAALNVCSADFPRVQATKSLIGHTLGAAGAIESAACVLQLHHGFLHGSINCEDPHPALAWCADKIVRETTAVPLGIIVKASFGFGDVNACVIFRKWKGNL